MHMTILTHAHRRSAQCTAMQYIGWSVQIKYNEKSRLFHSLCHRNTTIRHYKRLIRWLRNAMLIQYERCRCDTGHCVDDVTSALPLQHLLTLHVHFPLRTDGGPSWCWCTTTSPLKVMFADTMNSAWPSPWMLIAFEKKQEAIRRIEQSRV